MSLHLVESVDNILRNAAGMGKGDPLCPEVAENPIRSNRYLREDTLEELTGTMTPPALNFQVQKEQAAG